METTERENVTIQLDSPEEFIGLFGIREENLALFKDELGVEIHARGDSGSLSGEPDKVALAEIDAGIRCAISSAAAKRVDRTRIRYAIGAGGGGQRRIESAKSCAM